LAVCGRNASQKGVGVEVHMSVTKVFKGRVFPKDFHFTRARQRKSEERKGWGPEEKLIDTAR